MIATDIPYRQYADVTGLPLDGGYLYFGQPNQNPETAPITVYWDADGLIPATQPIRTLNGFAVRSGNIANIYSADDYSLTIKNKIGVVVSYSPTSNNAGIIAQIEGTYADTGGASLMGFLPHETGAVATTVQEELRRRRVNFFHFLTAAQIADVQTGTWYVGDVAAKRTAMYAAFCAAEAWMRSAKASIEFPDGWYEIGDQNYPFRNPTVPAVSLKDYYNTALFCSPNVTFATSSTAGADVLQLNAVKNFHVFGYPKLTAQIAGGSTVGSNGCSVTGGYDNVTLEIAPYNCPSVDRGTYIDGGKGLTIQTPIAGQTVECSSLKAIVRAQGCVHGFGMEVDLVAAGGMRTAVDVDLTARDCYIAATYSAGAATSTLVLGVDSGVRIKGHAIDCQQDLVLGRVPGIEVDLQVITTKSKAARQLSPAGVAWKATDTEVSALIGQYVHSSRVAVYGNKGACDYKVRLGGSTAGSSGITGATYSSQFYLDIAGSPSIVDVFSIDSGGNSVKECEVSCTALTSLTLPAAWYVASLLNTLIIGQVPRAVTPKFAGRTSFALGADGSTESAAIDIDGNITKVQGKHVATANETIAGLYDASGAFRLGIRNGNGLVIDTATTSSAVGAYISKFAVYNKAGTLIGYLPIYA